MQTCMLSLHHCLSEEPGNPVPKQGHDGICLMRPRYGFAQDRAPRDEGLRYGTQDRPGQTGRAHRPGLWPTPTPLPHPSVLRPQWSPELGSQPSIPAQKVGGQPGSLGPRRAARLPQHADTDMGSCLPRQAGLLCCFFFF